MNNKIGLAAFFQNFKESDNVILILEQYIEYLNFKEYPINVMKRRNILVYLTLFQILASIVGILYILFRRSFVYIIINLITLFLAACGIYGSIRVNPKSLLVHCLFTSSITTGFLLYQLIDLFLADNTSYGDEKRINDNIIMLIFSIPYLYDMFTGFYNYLFITQLSKHKKSDRLLNEEIEAAKNKYTDDEIKEHIDKLDKRICIICMDRERNTALNPCHHMLSCEECSKAIFNLNPSCPICRTKITSYTPLIIS